VVLTSSPTPKFSITTTTYGRSFKYTIAQSVTTPSIPPGLNATGTSAGTPARITPVFGFSKIAKNARVRIYLCKPVPLFRDRGKGWDTDKILAEEICPAIDEVARRTHATVIDLHSLLEGGAALFADRVHPNAIGAGIIAQAVCQRIESGK
jgi:hypothetical protein